MYLLLILVLVLGGCAAGKATYIKGGDKAMAVIEASMTGARISINGPFEYCSEPAITQVDGDGQAAIPDSICAALMAVEDEPVTSKEKSVRCKKC